MVLCFVFVWVFSFFYLKKYWFPFTYSFLVGPLNASAFQSPWLMESNDTNARFLRSKAP